VSNRILFEPGMEIGATAIIQVTDGGHPFEFIGKVTGIDPTGCTVQTMNLDDNEATIRMYLGDEYPT
jgi:hypothetical protein